MVKDYKKFLSIIRNLDMYLVEFEEDGLMKTKKYPNNYVMREDKYYFIIIITHNKYIFFQNDRIWKIWTEIKKTFV